MGPIQPPQTSVNNFYKQIVNGLPIGGNDSFNRIKQIYANMKKRNPDYKYEDLETLIQFEAEGKEFTKLYQELKEKIYDSCKEALKNDKEEKKTQGSKE